MKIRRLLLDAMDLRFRVGETPAVVDKDGFNPPDLATFATRAKCHRTEVPTTPMRRQFAAGSAAVVGRRNVQFDMANRNDRKSCEL